MALGVSSPLEVEIDPDVAHCLSAAQRFSEALSTLSDTASTSGEGQSGSFGSSAVTLATPSSSGALSYPSQWAKTVSEYASSKVEGLLEREQLDLKSVPRSIFLQKTGSSKEAITGLRIDFFENSLMTSFQGKEHAIKLSCALGIIFELSEIFAKVKKTEKLVSIEDQFADVLDTINSAVSDVKKEGMAFYPLTGRVVLSTSLGESSTPMKMIKDCVHLFNREFAQEICPMLGLESDVNRLQSGLVKLYVGRCILGLGASVVKKKYTEIEYKREFERIVSLIEKPGSVYYTSPLL